MRVSEEFEGVGDLYYLQLYLYYLQVSATIGARAKTDMTDDTRIASAPQVPLYKIDETTGEVKPGRISIRYDKKRTKAPEKNKSPYPAAWTVSNIEADSKLAEMYGNQELPHAAIRVWGVYFLHMEIGNWVMLPQKQIADFLKMDQGNLSKYTTILLDGGYLIKSTRHKSQYMIPASMSYRGAWKDFAATRDEQPQQGVRND
jgi:hypothetical protein